MSITENPTIVRSGVVRHTNHFENLLRGINARPEVRGWEGSIEALHALEALHTQVGKPLDEWDRKAVSDRRDKLVKLHQAASSLQYDRPQFQTLFKTVNEWMERKDIPESYRKDLETIRFSYWPREVQASRKA